MTTTALVMAGGKGTRMALSEEKPMLLIAGVPVITHVLNALKNAKQIDSVVVAVSDYTPKTSKFLEDFPVKILKTPGKEYVHDMAYAVKELNLETVLTVPADMPLLTSEVIDDVVSQYYKCGKSALAVVVPLETKEKFGMSLSYSFEFKDRCVVPAGLNVNDGTKIHQYELEQAIYVLDLPEIAININTLEELDIAEKMFIKTHSSLK
ncbi:MAG: NTP transferase domain-containing protein [Crenarchaeota archaeon]|nr:NTP transferase domain-containing protein [Thermoproteota archaeon]